MPVYHRALSPEAAPVVELGERRWIMSPSGVPIHRVRGVVSDAVGLELEVHRPGDDVVCLPAIELAPTAPVPARGEIAFEAAFSVPRDLISSQFRYEVVARAPGVAKPSRPPRRHRGLAVALMACGLVLVADAVATLVWKDPVTSLYTEQAQAGLRERLASDTASFTATQAAAPAPAPVTTTQPAHVVTRTVYPAAPRPDRHRAALQVARRAARFASMYNRSAQRGEPLGTIRIRRIGLKMVFVQGTGAAQLADGPAHYIGTSMPGQPGTVGIAGHRTTYLAPFRDLDQLDRGDPIELDTPYGEFTYDVETVGIVQPTHVDILDPSWTAQRLVLTSCHPVRSAAERIVVVARLRKMKVI